MGFNVDLIVLVFFLTLSESGISFSFTYGSDKPLGSIGIKLRPSRTETTLCTIEECPSIINNYYHI